METFTFLFTDIEGSTVLLGRVGQGVYARVLADHHAIIRSGLAAHGGREVDTQGDAFFAVFSSAAACVAAAIQMQQALRAHAWPAKEHVRVRMALWRDRLADKQLLLILDDAASSEQVRPLLPGTGGSLVLITSRRHLSALEEATAVSLDTLPAEEAAGLLVRLAARAGLGPEDPTVAEMTRLCGYLPLAIGMVARQLHHHPAWTAAGRAAELAAAVDRLELIATENVSVAAAFDLSYADLAPDQQQLFRRLGLHPGADIDAYAAAALEGTGPGAARRGLEALYDQYLLTEPAQGRYRMHDLIREHARALAGRLDAGSDRDRASARLLDYYQDVAGLIRQARTVPAAGAVQAAVPVLADRDQVIDWLRAERANLTACLDEATATGQHARIIALTAGLAGLLRLDGPWAEALTREAAAVRAAEYLGDRPGQATALHDLGIVRRLTGDYPGAARALEDALGLYRDTGDRPGQATALNNLGMVRRLTGDYPGAARALEEALDTSRDIADRRGQATALTFLGSARQLAGDYPGAARALEEALGISRDIADRRVQATALTFLGSVRQLAGDYPGAARALEEALGIYRDLGDRGGEAEALNEQGMLYRARGDHARAERCHRQALDLARAIASSRDEAHALAGLGRCALAGGHTGEAEHTLRQALEIFERIGAAEAAKVSAELETLNDTRPAMHGS